jgi:hypothetical protein
MELALSLEPGADMDRAVGPPGEVANQSCFENQEKREISVDGALRCAMPRQTPKAHSSNEEGEPQTKMGLRRSFAMAQRSAPST